MRLFKRDSKKDYEDDIYSFASLNSSEWQLKYKDRIRSVIFWDCIDFSKVKSGTAILHFKNELLFLPKYKDNFVNSPPLKPINTYKKAEPIIVRVPAIRIDENYYICDGMHRITQLKPVYIIVDYLVPDFKDLKAFMDAYYCESKI